MKNRIWKKTKGLTMTAFLLAAEILGCRGNLSGVQAEETSGAGIVMSQQASWTDRENGRGQIYMEVSGLLSLKGTEEKSEWEEIFGTAREEVYEEEAEIISGMDDTGTLEETVTEETMLPDGGENCQWAADWEDAEAAAGGETFEGAVGSEGAEAAAGGETWEGAAGSEGMEAEAAMTGVLDLGETLELPEPLGEEAFSYEEIETPSEDLAFAADEFAPFTASQSPIYVITYLSEYFDLDTRELPSGCQTEQLTITNQKGQQTYITKIICPIYPETFTEDVWALNLPVVLREEYRLPVTAVSYPICQDEPLEKDQAGTGAFVMQETLEGPMLLAQAFSPILEVEAARAEFTLLMKPDAETVKAGQRTGYEVTLTNTGELLLTDIQLQSVFSKTGLTPEWEEAKNLQIQGTQAVLQRLEPGETRTLYLSVQLSQEYEGSLEHTFSASTLHPGNAAQPLVQKAEAKTEIQALTADFTVEKTADRTIAMPGDTITYQICIRNTGERTLHSVVGTERFLNAGVNAQFVERPGVTLNGNKTQAMISQIMPGEAFALQAKVTLPYYMVDQDLINQVSVVSRETGSKAVQSQAGVTLQNRTFEPTPTPYTGNPIYYGGGGTKSSGSSWGVSSQPKTGDTTPIGFFAVLLLGAAAFGTVILRKKGKH